MRLFLQYIFIFVFILAMTGCGTENAARECESVKTEGPWPTPEAIVGSWTFDQQGFDAQVTEMGMANKAAAVQYQAMINQIRARHSKMTLVFDRDGYSIDSGNGKVTRIKCTYECFPPSVLIVQSKGETCPQHMHLSLDAKNKDRMLWNTLDATVPLKRKE